MAVGEESSATGNWQAFIEIRVSRRADGSKNSQSKAYNQCPVSSRCKEGEVSPHIASVPVPAPAPVHPHRLNQDHCPQNTIDTT
jgi:hypothetical protein